MLGFKQWSYISCPCKLTTTIWRLRDILSILWGLPWIPGNLGFHDLQLWCVNVGLDPISPILLNSAKNRQKRIRKNLNLFLPSGLDLPPLLPGKAKVCQKNGKKLICFGYLLADKASTWFYVPSPPRPSVQFVCNCSVKKVLGLTNKSLVTDERSKPRVPRSDLARLTSIMWSE